MMRVLVSLTVGSLLSCFAFGQTTEKPLTFELADVHMSPPSSIASTFGSMSSGVPRAGRYELRNASMLDLVRTAYGVEPEKVVGGPNWLAADRFDVIAKVPAGTTQENARLMLRTLLAERFALTVHNDSRPVSVFALSAGAGRPKMKPASGGAPNCQPQQQGPPQPGVIQYAQITCRNLTTEQIAQNLRQMAGGYLDKPVVDEAKLDGAWDFDLKWTARAQLPAESV
jgi:uncharacterized protein (TIGR03435 family)